MESLSARSCARRVICQYRRPPKPNTQRRCLATPSEAPREEIRAASPIQFNRDSNQFSHDSGIHRRKAGEQSKTGLAARYERYRIVPASASYFTAAPQYTDDLLELSRILSKYQRLPVVTSGTAPRVTWKTIDVYRTELAEPVRVKGYGMITTILKRLNQIHPAVFPEEVATVLQKFKRDIQPSINIPKPIPVNEWGVARAVGRRKSSSAQVWLVEGDGESMVNGRRLTDYFPRGHDRESALWALKATQRLDKYNVWVIVRGGGTTGQAEAITLGVAKALMAHEPALKPALRRAGVVSRDQRRVERKKPGKLKARKMPAWVKR